MSITSESFNSVKDPKKYEEISRIYTIGSSYGFEAAVLSYGARINKLIVKDKNGNDVDVMLGYKNLDSYLTDGCFHGAVVGRSANRVAGHSFVIDGNRYEIPANEGPTNLHTGPEAFQNVFWDGEILSIEDTNALILDSGIAGIPMSDGEGLLLSYVSPDGSCGFPGNLDTKVLYTWTEDKTFLILYIAETDKATMFAPTNHSYFNLSGHDYGDVSDMLILIDSDEVTVKDELNCPNGELLKVDGTDFDCRELTFVQKLLESEDPQIKSCKGIDQNYNLKTSFDKYSFGASLTDPNSGITMEMLTNMPGVQVYGGNHLSGGEQKGEKPYKSYSGMCLEAQLIPNAINVPSLGDPVIRPGETKYYACGYKFSV